MKNQKIKVNLPVAALVEETLVKGQGRLMNSGALSINTGRFTGRSPKDRYIVEDNFTSQSVDWGDINIPISQDSYDMIWSEMKEYIDSVPEMYMRDAYACASHKYRINIKVYTEYAWQNLFAYNMFLRPDGAKSKQLETDEWTIYAFPGFKADPKRHHTRQENFSIINFSKQTIIIGGTQYTGEIKKGIFSVLNYVLPTERNVLPMHCSANVGSKGDTALFFGLSGTGKTTLSNDVNRRLIGDDEHGWSEANVFNLEGGCYAKVIDLSESKEPQIYQAIRYGSLLENIKYDEQRRQPDYEDSSITQNTRVSYPIYHIDNIMYNSRGGVPENIFFLTCDAFGVLPPISKLSPAQAMYHFLSGYTAKIAGTEDGISEPQATFSACFGAPFLPLHPAKYAEMLGDKINGMSEQGQPIQVWLVNTGWVGGAYGEGYRIQLPYTRALIKAALDGHLNKVEYDTLSIFNLEIPKSCPDIPNALLNPRNNWRNEEQYDVQARSLAKLFKDNMKKYQADLNKEILGVEPVV